MKYQLTDGFDSEYGALPDSHKALFREAVRRINQTYAERGTQWPPSWPAGLRIKPLQGVPGIWEMTWSFSRPDGRAAFEFVTIDGERGIRWRRIGTHEIFRRP